MSIVLQIQLDELLAGGTCFAIFDLSQGLYIVVGGMRGWNYFGILTFVLTKRTKA